MAVAPARMMGMITALIAAASAAPMAGAQQPAFSGPSLQPPLTAPRQPAETGPRSPDSPPSWQPSSGVCRNDYWIVSTRCCRQAAVANCPGGSLDYFHVTGQHQVTRHSVDEFRGRLIPGAPVCIVVHGSFTTWRDVVEGGGRVNDWIRQSMPGRPMNMVVFTWPSDENDLWLVPQVNVGMLGRRAEFNGLYLAHLIAVLPVGHPLSLFGHSHGARVIAAGLHLSSGGMVDGRCLSAWPTPRRTRVVLAAAAIDQHWLNPDSRYGRALEHVECLLNVKNRNDLALLIYPLRRLFSNEALGRAGLAPVDRVQQMLAGRRVVEIDVSGLIDTGHLWDHYYRQPEIARAIGPYLYFEPCPTTADCGGALRRPARDRRIAR